MLKELQRGKWAPQHESKEYKLGKKERLRESKKEEQHVEAAPTVHRTASASTAPTYHVTTQPLLGSRWAPLASRSSMASAPLRKKPAMETDGTSRRQR